MKNKLILLFTIWLSILFVQKSAAQKLEFMPVLKGCEKFKGQKKENINCISDKIAKDLRKELEQYDDILEQLYVNQEIVNRVKLSFRISGDKQLINPRINGSDNNVLMPILTYNLFSKLQKKYANDGLILEPAKLKDGNARGMEFSIPVSYWYSEAKINWKKIYKKFKGDKKLIKQGGSLKLYLDQYKELELTKTEGGKETIIETFFDRSQILYSEFLYELMDALEFVNYSSDQIIKDLNYVQYLKDEGFNFVYEEYYNQCYCTSKISDLKLLGFANGLSSTNFKCYDESNDEIEDLYRMHIECKNKPPVPYFLDFGENLIAYKKIDQEDISIYLSTKKHKILVYSGAKNQQKLIKEFSYLYELKDTPYEKMIFKK